MDSVTISTPIGDVQILPESADHIVVGGLATVRGKASAFKTHYHRWQDDKFHLGKEEMGSYERKYQMTYFALGVTESFRSKVFATLDEFVPTWAVTNLALLEKAAAERREEAIEERRRLIAIYQEYILELHNDIAKLLNGCDLPKGPPTPDLSVKEPEL